MGFNTTVVILNDCLDSIRNDKKFGEELVQAILRTGGTGQKTTLHSHGGNVGVVVESHHSSESRKIEVGGNTGEVIQ